MSHLRLAPLSLLLLAAALPALAFRADPEPASKGWPQWRGVNRDGISSEKNLLKEWPEDGPKLLWRVKKIGTAYSGVAVVGDRIYTMGDLDKKQRVVCLDAKDEGKILWTTPIGPTHSGGGSHCTPVVAGKLVYVLGTDGDFACLDAASGKIQWSKNFRKDFDGRMMAGWRWAESPLVDGDKVICTPGADKAALVALKKDTGEEIWRSEIKGAGGAGYASPMAVDLGGTRVYVNWLGSGLVGVSANDGKLLWKYTKTRNGTANIPTPLVKGDLVFCSTGYNAGAALLKLVPDKQGGVTAKQEYYLAANELQNHHGGMVLVDGYVYCGHAHNQGLPRCVELKTGEVMWQTRGPGDGSAAVIYADGHLYFRYDNNVVALIEARADAYKLKSKFSLPKDTGRPGWQHPAIADGKLYIRGADSLFCFDVKAK